MKSVDQTLFIWEILSFYTEWGRNDNYSFPPEGVTQVYNTPLANLIARDQYVTACDFGQEG